MVKGGCSDCSHYHIHAISCIRGVCNPHYNLKCKDNTHGKHILIKKKQMEMIEMPSNEIVINGTIKHQIPDSFMQPLMSYLEMVKDKTKVKR